jgi:hypothetical protein
MVVVNAGTAPLPALPAAGDASIRIVEGGPYDRPRAANAALANATGEWLVFLDDDDTFAPTHVDSLLEAAAKSGGARVAYGATAVMEPDGKVGMVLGAPFNRLQLFTGNYVSISAALFHRSLLAEGVRFDESFACFEDWDFMIQLAQRTHFVYTGKPTNLWNAHAGDSGAGLGANKRQAQTDPVRERLVAKWEPTAAALRDQFERHVRAARDAARRREPRYESRHRAEAERLVRGPLDDGIGRGN